MITSSKPSHIGWNLAILEAPKINKHICFSLKPLRNHHITAYRKNKRKTNGRCSFIRISRRKSWVQVNEVSRQPHLRQRSESTEFYQSSKESEKRTTAFTWRWTSMMSESLRVTCQISSILNHSWIHRSIQKIRAIWIFRRNLRM